MTTKRSFETVVSNMILAIPDEYEKKEKLTQDLLTVIKKYRHKNKYTAPENLAEIEYWSEVSWILTEAFHRDSPDTILCHEVILIFTNKTSL